MNVLKRLQGITNDSYYLITTCLRRLTTFLSQFNQYQNNDNYCLVPDWSVSGKEICSKMGRMGPSLEWVWVRGHALPENSEISSTLTCNLLQSGRLNELANARIPYWARNNNGIFNKMQAVVVVFNDNDKVMTWLAIHQLQTYLGGTRNSKARRLFFLVQSSRVTASTSTRMSLYACIRTSAGSRPVFIVECIYVRLRSAHRAKRSFGVSSGHWHCQEDGNNCDHVGIKSRISVLKSLWEYHWFYIYWMRPFCLSP